MNPGTRRVFPLLARGADAPVAVGAAARDPVPSSPVSLETVMRLVTPGARTRKSRRLLVYVHVPFCSAKCHFCDWVVGYDTADLVNRSDLRQRYVDALCVQIAGYGPRLAELGYRVTNVYWGGGTPTRLTPGQLRQIHAALAEVFDLSSVIEHTAECSPETVLPQHLDALVHAGLNRISAGVQSFDDEVLARMGRAHDSATASRTVALFREFGLTNFNIDLITGFPDQGAAVVMASVRQAVDLGVPHISLYMFREFSTGLVAVRQLAKGHRVQASRAERAATYLAAKSALEAAGYEEYVVGYFALAPEYRFDGERYYFGFAGDYIGFGAGAASMLGRCALRTGDPSRYGSAQVRAFIEQPLLMLGAPVTAVPDDLYLDAYFKAFATREGIRFDRWLDQFGFDFRDLPRSRPSIQAWFAEQEASGARFVQTDRSIALSPETWIPTMMWRR